MRTSRKLDVALGLLLFCLPLLWFAPQALGDKTLLPADNLFTFEPWQSFAHSFGISTPHNSLISDLILENRAWKAFILDALRSGRLTDVLWNPRIFTGVPFLAAGQHSALYPLSAIFYILPLWRAYGVFTWLQIGLAAVGMYVFARTLRQSRPGATLAAVAFAFSGFFIVSVNFTMVIAAAAWLPLILAMIERVVQSGERSLGNSAEMQTPAAGGWRPAADAPSRLRVRAPHPLASGSPVPYVAGGAICIAVHVLAGHVEITYYTLLVSAFYSAWRLAGLWWRRRDWRPPLRAAGWLLTMVALGLALGGVQLIPLYELVTQSFREGSASLEQVRNWAWPSRQIITFLLPDFFGNPTHHAYFDIWLRQWAPVTQNALGESLNTIDWGVKNYVEGGSYLGIGTLLLAVIGAVIGMLDLRKARYPVFFTVLAVLSLLFAFGTPLYAILYYGLPGYSQLHSAFRWVFPYTLSMAMLAGFGLDALVKRLHLPGLTRPGRPPLQTSPFRLEAPAIARGLGALAIAGGAIALLVVLVSACMPDQFTQLGDRLLLASDLARTRGFATGAMAWSYEATGLARFGVMALLAGILLVLAASPAARGPNRGDGETGRRSERQAFTIPLLHWSVELLPAALIALVILDLWLFGHSFNPAADPQLLDFEPPVVRWLQERQDVSQPWRIMTLDAPGEKTVNPNSGMPYGLEDVRGYDSIIPRQYVAFMDRIQPQAGDLLYNRIGPIYSQLGGQPNLDALDSRLLDLLGVRYVVTTQRIDRPGYQLAYEQEVRVYENRDALPRVFVAPQALAAGDQKAALDALQQVDPSQTVVVEGISPEELPAPASPQLREARISNRANREVFVDVNVSDRSWLVFTDAYFDGWKAYIRPFGAQGEGVTASGESVEQQLQIYRADGAFRAVYLPQAGQWTVRFVYSPRSFLLGGYTSFLAGVILLMLAGWWAWKRFYRGPASEVGTVAKNSAVQVVMSLVNKGLDFAFAMLRLRVLGPAGQGGFRFAIAFYLVFEILTRYGLGTLLTRDVAQDRRQAKRYLTNVVGLRVGLWLVSLPLMFLVGLAYRLWGGLTDAEAQAIAFFAASLLFANVADAISAVFNAFEKMEYPASLTTVITIAKVTLSAVVLLPPLEFGFVGLSGVSLLMNVVQAIWLYALLRRKILAAAPGEASSEPAAALPLAQAGAPSLDRQPGTLNLDWPFQRHMLAESTPLMLNHLLATAFWRISEFVLRGFAGDVALGIFSAGTAYLDGLNVIPSYFTLAIFPLMSRYARAGSEALIKAYRLAVQLLFIVALPIAVFFSFAAKPLIQILGGAAYLPDSATALAIMAWSIPIGFVNSVTQYTLIAVDQKRFLTRAFMIGVAFTTVANLIFVPRFGYIAAAIILIPAELSLFIAFYWAVRRHVTAMPWARLLGGPLLAAGADAAAVWGLTRAGVPLLAALAVGFGAYVAALLLLGTFRGDDFAVLRARLPAIRLLK